MQNPILDLFFILALLALGWLWATNDKAAKKRQWDNRTLDRVCERCKHRFIVDEPWNEGVIHRQRLCRTCQGLGPAGGGDVHHHYHQHPSHRPANRWSALTVIAVINGIAILCAFLIPERQGIIFAGIGMEFAITFLYVFKRVVAKNMGDK